MPHLIIVRHGQSVYNLENRFTGWTDVELTDGGREQAHFAAEKLKGYPFHHAYTSELKRAIETLNIILSDLKLDIPVIKNKALNERNYGDLQGLSKAATVQRYGDEQVHIWRRSYDVAPPGGESLKDTIARVLPYYEKEIRPEIEKGKDTLLVAHGNSLRALRMHLEGISHEKIAQIEMGTGEPWLYNFDDKMSITEVRPL
ncbi:MAG: 2,3-bisphosphoglycerate-dependent phosphoglycerate mutase [Mucilaginibacter polytrichastri]|nr:2,3-bisphosphoglycerate-dependent phosphoglycerate mutase [Mucilaginibacter polytrichastri]